MSDVITQEQTTEETTEKTFTQADIDSAVSKGVEAYKAGKFKTAVESEITKQMEEFKTTFLEEQKQKAEDAKKKTPAQIEVEKIKRELESEKSLRLEREAAELRALNLSKAKDYLSENKLPLQLADYLIGKDAESTTQNLEAAKGILDKFITEIKQGILKTNNIQVPGKTITDPNVQIIQRSEFNQLSPMDQMRVGQKLATGEMVITD